MIMKGFIGGWSGSGSRLLTKIFEKLGYYVAKEFCNYTYDFGDIQFVKVFDRCFNKNNYNDLFRFIADNLDNKENFVIKHGQFMFIPDELRNHFTDSKFIFINRNPIDCALKHYNQHQKYGNIKDNNIDEKIKFFIKHSKKASEKADLIVDYENLCANPEDEIIKIEKFCNLDRTITNYDFIKPSKNIGSGSKYYNQYN